MSEREIKDLQDAFGNMDENKDGVLTLKELQAGMSNFANLGCLAEVFEQVDTNGDGELQYTEFLAAAMGAKRYLHHDMAWTAFQQFDKNGDGQISIQELREVFQ